MMNWRVTRKLNPSAAANVPSRATSFSPAGVSSSITTLSSGTPAIAATCAAGSGAREMSCGRSEEHTSELQSLMRISYAVFCLKKKKKNIMTHSKVRDNKNKKTHEYTNYLQL